MADRRRDCPPDGGYGWIVATNAGLITSIGYTVFRLLGLIYLSLLQNTNYTRGQVTVAVVVPGTIASLSAVFAVKLCELYSFRVTLFMGSLLFGLGLALSSLAINNLAVFILTFVIFGIGAGCLLTPGNVVAGLYFTKKRPIALGFVTALSGVVIFIMPVVLQHFLNEFHLKGALLLWGGVGLHGCVAAMLIRQPTWPIQRRRPNCNVNKDEIQTILAAPKLHHPNQSNGICQRVYNVFNLVLTGLARDCHHFRQRIFILLLCSRMAYLIALISIPFVLPQFAMEEIEKITFTESAILLSVENFGEVLAKLLGGWLNTFILPKHRLTAYLISFLCMASVLILFQFTHTLLTALIVSVFNGLFSGYVFVTYYVVIFDIFGTADAPGVIGLHTAVLSICFLSSMPIMVWIRDMGRGNKHCFTFLSLLLVVSVLLWLCIPVTSYFKKRQYQKTQNENMELNA